ncbi:MAG: hypothetical protein HY581_09050 [Nitrospirae bacterium]|nr:hypothetical protein [Nitrospirota bacterium]
MRKPHQITIDRALLVYLLHQAEPFGIDGDVKLQQLAFLCELQMFGKRLKGFHFEFFRYAYGAFSKDLDNDLLSLRRKERVQNFSLTDKAQPVLKVLEGAVAGHDGNERVIEILQAVVATYAPQDGGTLMKSVEAVEISSPDQPEQKLSIGTISFHSTLLVPSRIETEAEFSISPPMLARLNAALGY